MKAMNTTRGRNICTSETPAAFMAISSKRSPKFPKVINAARSTASGKEAGTNVSPA